MEAPDGRDAGCIPDRMGDFSPCLLHPPFDAEDFDPPSGPGRPKSQSKDPHVPPTGSVEPSTPANGRFPFDHP